MRKTLASAFLLVMLTGCASAAPAADDLDDNYSVVKSVEGFGTFAAANEDKKTPFIDVVTRESAEIIFYSSSNCPPVVEEVKYGDSNLTSGNHIVRLYIKRPEGECSKDVSPYVQTLTFKKGVAGVDLMNSDFKYCVKESNVCFDFERVFYQSGNNLEKKK